MRYISFDAFTRLLPDQFRITLEPEVKVRWDQITLWAQMTVYDLLATGAWWETHKHPEANTVYSSVFSQEFAFEQGVYKRTKYHSFTLPQLKTDELVLFCSVLFDDDRLWGISFYIIDEKEELNERMARIYLQENEKNARSESLKFSWGTLFTGENNYHDSRDKAVCLSLK